MKFCLRNLISRINNKKTAESLLAGTAAFCAVLAAGLIFYPADDTGNGQGGFETPGLPVVKENDLAAAGEELEAINEISYHSYRVRKGDMIGIIAENFGITEDTIISVNNIRSSRLLQIGTYLKIPSIPGILYTVRENGETPYSISQKYNVDMAKLCSVNSVENDLSLKAGNMVFVPDAKLDWVTRQEINGDLFKKPIHNRWYLSSPFGWRKSPFTDARSYHGGVDMACSKGTKIFAAMPGVVTSTGFNNVYGNYVIISHHSGYSTLYGHMDSIKAYSGQRVGQESVIGYVGSTGMSTGPHLHFTVYKNGKQVNPANLWN